MPQAIRIVAFAELAERPELLKPRQSMRFSLNLTSKYPLRVQARPSVIYEYYKPENRAQSRATTLQVL